MSYNSNYTGDEVVELLGRQFVVPVVSVVPDTTLSSWHDDKLNKDTNFSVSDMCRYGDQVYQLLSIDGGSYNWAVLSHVVYLPEQLLSVNADTTIADIVALLGDLDVLYNNIKRGCRYAIKSNVTSTQQYYINVDISVNKTGTIYSVQINYKYNKDAKSLLEVNITFISLKTPTGTGKIKYNSVNMLGLSAPTRIELPNGIYFLTSDSDSNEISLAVGGVDGFKDLVNKVKGGGECYFNSYSVEAYGMAISEVAASCMGQIVTEGNINQYYLGVNCYGYGFAGGYGGSMLIIYTDSVGFSMGEYKSYSVS